jgi:hypothetical protein
MAQCGGRGGIKSYWGRNPNDVIDQWRELDRIRSQVEVGRDIIQIRADLWMLINDGVVCSCKKDEGFDRLCFTCYGSGWVGGYRKVINKYLTFGATGSVGIVDDGTVITLSSPSLSLEIEQVTDIIPYRYRLKDGETSGTITWTSIPFSNIWDFEYDLRAFLRDTDLGSASVTVEVDIDAGGYVDISTIVGNDYVGGHSIDVRVTLTRSITGMRSPLFEIMRGRGRAVKKDEDYIILSKNRGPEDEAFERAGFVDRETGVVGLWTILDFEILPRSLVEMLDSPFSGNRYQLFNFRRSFFKDKTFRQIFDGRIISDSREIYTEVF